MQTPKTRSGSSEVPQKVSPRAVRQLRPTTVETDSVSSSSQANKSSKERSPKVTDRRSPRSPVVERKRPSKISELESQISQLQNDLKKVMDQLVLSESSKRQAQQDALESKEQLLALSAKFEDSQKHVLDLCAAGEGRVLELQKIIDERDMACQSELEASKKQLSVESAALASAMNEIQMLKTELELVANCESVQSQQAKSADMELLNLKQNLSEALSLVDTMKNQLRDYKESEAQAQALVNETMLQHEAAKKSIEILRADVAKAVDAYNTIALELDQSKARVSSLEALVSKLQTDPISSKFEHQPEIWIEGEGSDDLEAEVVSLKSEVGRLQYAVETAETKYQEEKIQSTVQIRSAYELVEQIKSETGKREGELEAELKRKKADIEELKANLMDKETELQGIVEENDNLNTKLQESMSSKNEHELKRETKRLEECVAELKSDMMDKETTLQSISEENEMLKMEINKLSDGGKVSEEVAAEVEGAKAAEREALMKLGIVMEEADRSNKKAARVAEQLEAAQAANLEMEAELRRLKVQSDQWRKAAEAAAAMLSSGNNGKLTERTVSLDNNYKCSPYAEDMDDDFQRKKNGNMLKKFGVLWKKPQK
ncbi:Interactor of constitutive active ROPs 3 ROP-interactive partner 5 [Vigna angularis]|uniref:Interactor of constitutive active ROPs 3 ROP-interactive partner 5 n=1 Tax=Phaseolus angularis TaxID=3914 RepID=A0A8T0KGU5_PHAAN|nr:interactor of constitutive active ROPs 3 [Vigna angularis]XP_017433411.1 interactor of constitutive active ROPs 3 [Vigna angularis]XP_017433412.1 interactor of constitutive active ROPs 3 [Vigna angularis]XP_017433414.1 interactor of constitutive active ROPs 3 [Vigna angularis]XP_017433415.1 interactor of constitutive active ROPs 3 [Vigna angularis]XP_017433416.1 interactor of constitutive active ROPs 3 [Vigna angularis]XP_017433418.1 interactor of constitutive active ROPs 3 [Vigna angulari